MRRRAATAWLVVALAVPGACSSGNKGAAPGPAPAPTDAPASSTTTSSPPPAAFPGPPDGPVPGGFAAASVTFVSLRTGWVLGTAPCSSPPCTSLVRTRDGGRTWAGVPAPRTELSLDRSAGVSQVRFADADNGWAFGPELWATHDGGARWSRVTLPGVGNGAVVSDLAASSGVVHAAVIAPGTGEVRILTSPVGADEWRLSPTTVSMGAGPVPRAQLVLQGTTGWLVEVDRTVVGGARLAGGAWVPWQPPCANAGGPAVIAASTPSDLFAVCDEGVWTDAPRSVRAYTSKDGGTTFQRATVPVPLGGAAGVASGAPGSAVVAGGGDGRSLLLSTFDAGATWATTYRGSGQLSYVGLTSARQGVAVEEQADGRAGTLLMTVDGGRNWNVVAIR